MTMIGRRPATALVLAAATVSIVSGCSSSNNGSPVTPGATVGASVTVPTSVPSGLPSISISGLPSIALSGIPTSLTGIPSGGVSAYCGPLQQAISAVSAVKSPQLAQQMLQYYRGLQGSLPAQARPTLKTIEQYLHAVATGQATGTLSRKLHNELRQLGCS